MDTKIDLFVRGERAETTNELREYALRRLSFAVSRFRHRIRDLRVRLVDENGPRRGVDSRCSIEANLVDGGPLFVEATAAWPFAAVTLAAGRLREALRRNGSRQTAHRGGSAGAGGHKREREFGVS